MLDEVRDAGYSGVEVAQHPQEFGPASDLYQKLKSRSLTFVGIAGGALTEKIAFVREYVVRRNQDFPAPVVMSIQPPVAQVPLKDPPYIYIDEWDGERAVQALEEGFTLAIHPHMFKSIQTSREAEALLDAHPRLRFLPDTAHLTVAGEKVTDLLAKNFNRLAAVHLKDWTAEFGRAYQFYARGFVELGKGDVPLRPTLQFLNSRGYTGWLVVEQDTSPHPAESAKASRDWLRRNWGN